MMRARFCLFPSVHFPPFDSQHDFYPGHQFDIIDGPEDKIIRPGFKTQVRIPGVVSWEVMSITGH